MAGNWRTDLEPEDFNAFAREVAKTLGAKIAYDLLYLSRSCVVCKHFNADNETCGLNRLRPPARIIAFGCELFERF